MDSMDTAEHNMASEEIVQQVGPNLYKVCPPASELRAPAQKNVCCPVIDCNKICKQPSALRFHLERVHKIFREKQKWELNTEKSTVQWHCPEPGCVYSIKQERYFSSRTLLKQHYGKLHLEKTLRCDECGKMFGLEKDRKRHMNNNCTLIYTCTCGSIYMHRESYMMHCSREKHPVKEEYKLKREVPCKEKEKRVPPENVAEVQTEEKPMKGKSIKAQARPGSWNIDGKCLGASESRNKLKPILPNPNIMIVVNVVADKNAGATTRTCPEGVPTQLIYIADARSANSNDASCTKAARSARVSQGCQTKSPGVLKNGNTQTEKPFFIRPLGPSESSKGIQAKKQVNCIASSQTGEGKPMKRRAVKSSACTQTSLTKQKHMAAQTQTMGDLILRQAMQSADIPTQRRSRASQVTPQVKVKSLFREHSIQSTETQTAVIPTMYDKCQPDKATSRYVSMGTNTPVTAINDFQDSTVSDTTSWQASEVESQTDLLSEFQFQFPCESAATQTLESFLLNDLILTGHETMSRPQSPPRFHSLTETTDQAVLCDLGLVPEIHRPAEAGSCVMPCGRRTSHRSVSSGGCSDAIIDKPEDVPMEVNDTNKAIETLADIDFSQNSPVMALSDMLKDDLIASGASSNEIILTNATDMAGKQDLINCLPTSSSYGSALYTSTSEMDSGLDMVSSLQEPLLSDDSMLASTGGCLYSHTEAQTNISDLDFPQLLTSGVQTSNMDACYMNIETQTTDGNMIDQLLNSMETQTSDDFFAEFGFSNNETQTHLSLMAAGDNSPIAAMLSGSEIEKHQMSGPSVGIQTICNSQMSSLVLDDMPNQLATDSIGIQTQVTGTGAQPVSSFSVGIQTQQNNNLMALQMDTETQTLVTNIDIMTPLMDTETQTQCTNIDMCPDLSDSYTQTAFDDLVSFVNNMSEM